MSEATMSDAMTVPLEPAEGMGLAVSLHSVTDD